MIHYFRGQYISFEEGKRIYDSQPSLREFSFVEELTFEDWKEKNIPPPPAFYWKKIRNYFVVGLEWYEYWAGIFFDTSYDPPLMSKEEYKKVKEAKERVYRLGIEMMVDSKILKMKEEMEGLPIEEKEVFLELEISSINESFPKELLRKVYKGDLSIREVTPSDYRIVHNFYERFEKGKDILISEITYPDTGKTESRDLIYFDDLFAAHVGYGYLKKLKKLKKEIETHSEKVSNEAKNSELSEEERYKIILNAPEGIKAGKMAFMHYLKRNNEKVRTWGDALNIANEFYLKYKGKKLYKSENSFFVSHSTFQKTEDGQHKLNKILNRVK
ncbi:hypothetical protein [Fodinibius sp.]|uniref:hypothetical protein n=1 Tax=Fodinibius sp. TaxID=1872440 RepID=UPI002ACE5462|nr:hypothetical protein [Fodinibius sp.]MDZ7660052.1 hypothetical protein [Fodinibius sp.]